MCVCVCACACVRVCVCVRACVRARTQFGPEEVLDDWEGSDQALHGIAPRAIGDFFDGLSQASSRPLSGHAEHKMAMEHGGAAPQARAWSKQGRRGPPEGSRAARDFAQQVVVEAQFSSPSQSSDRSTAVAGWIVETACL